MEFNINDMVLVKLTDVGREILKRQHVEFWAGTGRPAPHEYTPTAEDAEGWSRWQLWCLMQDLGPHVGNGLPLPFETTIRIVEPKPRLPPPEDPISAARSMCG